MRGGFGWCLLRRLLCSVFARGSARATSRADRAKVPASFASSISFTCNFPDLPTATLLQPPAKCGERFWGIVECSGNGQNASLIAVVPASVALAKCAIWFFPRSN
jgi:hypothetical protein